MNIPKLIHQIWIGDDKPLPMWHSRFLESWKTNHPQWTYKLWTNSDVFPLRNQHAFDVAPNVGSKSDILRYEILYRYGGLYADIDFESLKPLDPLLETVKCDAFAGFESPTHTYAESISNALIGCEPQSAFIGQLIENLPENCEKVYAEAEKHGFETTSRATGPAYLTSQWLKNSKSGLTVFPVDTFFPRYVTDITNTTYCFHHMAGMWR
jgi:mannosyltransferase OCH1-like enzyme